MPTFLFSRATANNCMKEIPKTAKIGRGSRPSPIWLSEENFETNYFHVVPLLINCVASQLLGIAQSRYFA